MRCVGSSAALMLAMVLTAMSSLWWMAFLSVIVLLYKQAPLHGRWDRSALSAALVLAGFIYALGW